MNLMININRLHPLFVHLPIGILFFAGILYVFKKWKDTKEYDAALYLALICACGAAIFSSGTGWFLSNEGGYDTDLIFWHKWLGIATTISIFLLVILYKQADLAKKYLGFLFLVSLGLLAVTGHHGGSLTHGTEYLFESVDNDQDLIKNMANPEALLVFQEIIQPILQKKCVTCHKTSKQKGELLLTNFASIMKGGKSGPIINKDLPKESELLKRILLPIDEKKHMPPKGKIQITEEELAFLTWWIDNNACGNCKVKDTEGKEKIIPLLKKYVRPSANLDLTNVESLSDKQVVLLQNSGIKISSISDNNPLVSLNITNKKEVTKGMLKAMKPIRKNIQEINLSGTTLNKSLIDFIVDLPNLENLQLTKSTISDQDISKLKELKNLQILNLFSTEISDKSIKALANIPTLAKVFLWQSKITSDGVIALQKEKPTLEIHHGIDSSIFGKASLNPPAIMAKTDLFEDSLSVTLESNLKNTAIYYSLDGSEPDTNSLVYSTPFVLRTSQKIKAISSKKNWGTSEINTRQFIQVKNKIKGISLSSPPSPNYPGEGANTLIDQRKSDTDFRNGQWLGFEGTHITATLELSKLDTIESLYISTISDPNSWIHYPKGAVVSISPDGKNYREIQKKQIEKDHRDGVELSYFDLVFDPMPCKFIKVEIKSTLKNPDWHPSPGGAAWLFLDEIFVN